MAGKGSAPGERRGGRKPGTPNQLPDLRALTLKALMQAGGVDYLAQQAMSNPGPFLGLLGRVMPREIHTELTADVRIRQEVRRDLVEKVIVLLQTVTPANPAIEHEAAKAAIPTIAHKPDAMLKAQATTNREGLSRRAENARRESSDTITGVVMRAAALQDAGVI